MSIRIVASGDQHIGAKHLTTLEEQDRALRELMAAAAEADVLLLAGDSTHHARPDPDALALWGDALRQLEDRDVEVVAIAGNHEGEAVTRVIGQFRGHVHIATTPQVIRLGDPSRALDVACLPWLVDAHVRAAAAGAKTKEEVAHALTEAAREILRGLAAQRHPDVPLVLLTHATIAGAETSTGWSMGHAPTTGYVLPLEELAAFDFVFAGHIHRHQKLADNAAYTGSLLPLDFSETEPKGYIAADVEPGRPASWSFVPIATPAVLTDEIHVVDGEGREAFAASIDALSEVREDLEGALVRVRVRCDELTAREVPAARIEAAYHAAGARRVQVEIEVARETRTRDEGMRDDLTPADALERYLAGRADLEELARVAIRARGATTLEELQQQEAQQPGGSLELTAVSVRDFLGVHEADVAFDGAGVVALTGPVGAGKSSVGADAIRYALFGVSRYGQKSTDRVVRIGADGAQVSLSLRGADGHEYQVVRKTRTGARGSSSSLDVLERNGSGWRPLSSGKIESGQAAIGRILGGLSDPTLCASAIVVQRESGRFAAARPDERKALLAEAANLNVYDDLYELARAHVRETERALAGLDARAAALRVRVSGVVSLEAEHTLALAVCTSAEADAVAARRRCDEVAAALERERARALEYERASGDATRTKDEQTALEAELATWDQKRDAANRILAERGQLEAARAELDVVRVRITALEAEQAEQLEQMRAVRAAEQEVTRLEASLRDLRVAREHVVAGLRREIKQGEDAQRRLDDASCCADEPSCVFIDDARKTVARLRDLDRELAAAGSPTADEKALQERVDRFEIPDEPDTRATVSAIAAERSKVPDLERRTAVAEKIAKAEQVLEEHASATTKLRDAIAAKRTRVGNLNQLLLGFAGSPVAAAARLERDHAEAERQLDSARDAQRRASERAAVLVGRLEQMSVDTVELAGVEEELHLVAADSASLSELASAWKACRVLVLESSVLPSVERTANEVLARFPYGIRIGLNTQRETRAREQSETLEIEILGGRAPVYEGLSGGQKTAVDTALHIAIALVVSRRATSRIALLFADEPEGLDEPGRAAFAAIARWVADEFGLLVIVASHSPDLIDALGARRIDIVPSPDGSTAVAA